MQKNKFKLGFGLPILLALAFASIMWADASIPNIDGGNMLAAPDYAPVAGMIGIGLALMVFVVSLVYMAASVFKNPEWEAFAKTELYQILIGVVLGVFVFAGAFAIDGAVRSVAQADPFEISGAYLQNVVCVSSATTLKLEGLKMASQYLAGMKSRFYAAAAGWGFSFPTFPGFDVIERAVDLILIFISPFTASLIVQGAGLEIVHATALTIVLPAGILLRVFPPTRDAGSFLIASAIAFYFILPAMYVINAQVMGQLYYEEFGYAMCSGGESTGNEYIFSKGSFYDNLSFQMIPKIKEDMIGTGGFTASLSYVAFQAVFLPALDMIMVVTFVTAGMKFFSQKME